MKPSEILKHAAMAAVVASLATATLAAAQEAPAPLPKAEVILDKYIEATGGKAAYEKRHSEVTTATIEFVGQGVKGTLTSWEAEPDKLYIVMDLEGVGKIKSGVNSGIVWEKSALQGPRIRKGVERAVGLRQATFNGSLLWRKLFPKAETVGVEPVDGEDCYKVVLTPAEGADEIRFYSKKTGFLVKTTTKIDSPMGEVPVESVAADYKAFAGILEPTKTTQKIATVTIASTVESVKVNEEIPPEKFALPAEIKALMDKEKAEKK